MEMVEEEQSQVNVSPEFKFQKIVEKGEENRISALPDCLLLEILARLPTTKGAIRTDTLSKRWKHIWTLLPVLIFTYRDGNHPLSDFVSLVDKTLAQCRQVKLKTLRLTTRCDIQFQSHFNNWIRYAISRNVEQLGICFVKNKFMFDHNFYISSCFTGLGLNDCILNPSGTIGWKNLKSLRLAYMYLDEDLIENILSGSPLLEDLVLESCYGYRQLDITSKSVKFLMFSRYLHIKVEDDEAGGIIRINAPNSLSLVICDDLMLRRLLLLNVSSLIEADLDYVLEDYSKPICKEEKEEVLKGLILSLRHVKELKIGSFCSRVLPRLKAKGFDFPPNVKFPDEIWSESDNDSVESEEDP